mgnify:FL=1
MDYEQLLKKAKKSLPEVQSSKERFEIPKVSGHIEGNKTIINNFFAIVKAFNRNQDKLLKYLQRELATPAQIDGQRLILGRKINSDFINKKIEEFAIDFVLCKECHKPDTQIIKDGRVSFLKCTACGAKYPLRAKI